jgi:Ca-activated chloride channel family protein
MRASRESHPWVGRRRRRALALALLAAVTVAGGPPAAGPAIAAPMAAAAQAGQAPPATEQTVVLTAAPVRLIAPVGRDQWTLRLATYADAAAAAFAEILGTPAPAGTLRWTPDPLAATRTDAALSAEITAGGLILGFDDPFAILAEDYGVAFAQGYARWLTAYAVARLYFSSAHDPRAWWIDGAALYMTDLLARRERSATPVLYNFELAYTRAVRARTPVVLGGAAAGLDEAARGKAYATFRLLEAQYGAEPVRVLLGRAAGAVGAVDFGQLVAGSLAAGVSPDPEALLGAWMQPGAAIDVGLSGVSVEGQGARIRGTVTRSGDVPIGSRVEVRLASGERLEAAVAPGTGSASWALDISGSPVSVTVDPEGLLPDVNRGNNRYGFGDASRIERFFPLDREVEIGELHLLGDLQQVGRKRVEGFEVTLRNLTDEPLGLGLLVSAQWLSRPADRTQRRVFVVVPPNQQVLARDFVEFPRRGDGRARIEARYWRAPDPEALTARLLRDDADLLNSYMVLREPAEISGVEGTPLERLAAGAAVESMAALTIVGAGESFAGDPGGAATATASGVAAEETEELVVRIVTPLQTATPLGEMTFTVAVDGAPARLIELSVNNQLVGRGAGSSARATFEAAEDESVFVLRALAVGADGRISTDTRVLQRGAVGFASSVDLVTLNLTVRQAGGGFLEDLTIDNFRVIEDGVPQQLEGFAKGEDTAVLAAMLLDTSSSMVGGGIRSAQAGANELVDSLLRGNDRAMVLGFNDRLYLYADFTNEVPALRRAIAATQADGGTRLYDAIVESLRKVNRRTGRRALIVLSDGLDVGSRFAFADVLEYTRQSDVQVYTIGLQLMHDATELGDANEAVRAGVENLRSLAEVTGGSAYFPLRLDELEGIYAEIAAELESQYSVSYYPSNQQWDGRWRPVQVELVGAAGRVQSRPGYYGVRPDERR